MVQPIRALGLSVTWYGRVWCCAYPACSAKPQAAPRLSAPLWAWMAYGPSSLEHGLNPAAIINGSRIPPPVTVTEPGRSWKPWPARQPFIDDVTRPWPSDDWPVEEPMAMIEEIDRPIEVIDWRHIGGALDMWI